MIIGTWGANWTCCDKCCRCDCCWDAGEYDPNNRPGDGVVRKHDQQQQVDQAEGDGNAPPAYKATDPMTVTPRDNEQAPVSVGTGAVPGSSEQSSLPDATASSQPQATVAAASNAGRTQTGLP